MKITPATHAFPYPTLAVSLLKLIRTHVTVVGSGCHYKLGAKVDPITALPGSFHEVDCSGYVRYLLRNCGSDFPDGSAIQHDAVKAAGFKHSDAASLKLKDGALRIAFLRAQDGGGTGHVALWLNGESIESHGGTGPDRRTPEECGWLAAAFVYVLTAPEKG